ncbi:MAG TPA: hypothetical protein VNK91_06170 [Burkholderiaceae bacterium]|nr:hypothetical protein [Burkholderiaceae bacterium]
MNKPLAAIAVAVGLAAPVGAALAQPVSVRIDTPEIGIRIGHPLPHLHVPAPVVIAPPPVVYAPPRVVVAPPVVYPVPPYYRAYYKGHWHKHRWHKHHWHKHHGHGHRDHRWDDDDDRRGRRHGDWD